MKKWPGAANGGDNTTWIESIRAPIPFRGTVFTVR
jgi:hypothetical protein